MEKKSYSIYRRVSLATNFGRRTLDFRGQEQTAPSLQVIAGPNGVGKTAFTREYFVQQANVVHFVNRELIAAGLSPLIPVLAARAAGRTVMREIDRLVAAREDFAVEFALSGLNHARRMQRWKRDGPPVLIERSS